MYSIHLVVAEAAKGSTIVYNICICTLRMCACTFVSPKYTSVAVSDTSLRMQAQSLNRRIEIISLSVNLQQRMLKYTNL